MKNKNYACLTLLEHGSMRFNWEHKNPNRNEFFKRILPFDKKIAPIQLIHSKTVIAIDNEKDTQNILADGIITCNPNLIPVVTVADCMPIYLSDPITGCFGVLHSGWKGTGIVVEALSLAQKEYGAKASDFHITLGPHIKDCCYTVDKERADFFSTSIDSSCIKKLNETSYALSLEKANILLLEKSGVKKEHITTLGSCTNCSVNNFNPIFGSFRRQTKDMPPDATLEERFNVFSPMAAFTYTGNPSNDMLNSLLIQEF